jgi:hypothetical protein
MVKYTDEMRRYDKVCEMLTSAGITYSEKPIEKYKVAFALTKDGKSAELIVDCASEYAEEQAEYGIKAFEHLLQWSAAEEAKKKK